MIRKNIGVWGESHKGYKRKSNEDRFLIKEMPGIIILAVADGVGGNPHGGQAAAIVIDSFREYKFIGENLKKELSMALALAERRIHHEVNKNPNLHGMGATATAVVLNNSNAFWIHVGDSRIYLLRDKKLKQITTDHTFIQDFLNEGSLTPEQAKNHPLKNMLEQCVGCDEMQPDCGEIRIKNDDRLLLCSDGLTTHLSDLQIECMLNTKSTQEAGEELIRTALKSGGEDNVTVIVKDLSYY
jgi:protein phosphatase